jgi:hypothetical protein
MRTYGRVYDPDGLNPKWVEVTTDANGFDDAVWLTTLIQVLKLNLQESPFFAQYGLPAVQSVMQQLAPDYYISITQQQFAPYFANLQISRSISADGITPTYLCNVLTNQGAALLIEVPG